MATYKDEGRCSICEKKLGPSEDDICDGCRRDLGATVEDEYDTPDNRPEDSDWR